jgi:hypothetical protein
MKGSGEKHSNLQGFTKFISSRGTRYKSDVDEKQVSNEILQLLIPRKLQ